MYNHGIYIIENPTSIQQPIESLSATQVVFGTSPINLIADPSSAVNKPIVARSFDEAKQKLGYSEDWNSYTLSEVMDAAFKRFKVSPVVFINVLDPAVHKTAVASQSVAVTNKEALIDHEGVLLSSVVVKNTGGTTTYVKGTDYLIAFNNSGKPVISVLTGGTIGLATQLSVSFDKIDSSKVTNADVIGGYDSATNAYEGFELIQTIYPTLGLIPNLLMAPKYSKNAEVGNILTAKASKINGCFNASVLLDVAGNTKEEANAAKIANEYTDKSTLVCWPKAKIGERTYHLSTILAGTTARTDAENDNVPFKSPSNKKIPVTALVNDAGKEVWLDQVQGNILNGYGIVTAVNMKGWRTWGNSTAAYNSEITEVMDPKDRFIAVRRMFDWWGNTFIESYFDKVDEPGNLRLIESVVDSENIRVNGFKGLGQIAGGSIEFRRADNPISEILSGKIQFIQKVAFFTPAEEIVNVLEFDPTILANTLFGGE